MKRIFVALAVLLSAVGCENSRDYAGWRHGDLVSCGATVSNSVVVVAIEDFKFQANDERTVGYHFVIANKTDGLATYDGVVTVKGRGFNQKIPLAGVLKGGERKTINERSDMGKQVHDVEVAVSVEGTQVRQ